MYLLLVNLKPICPMCYNNLQIYDLLVVTNHVIEKLDTYTNSGNELHEASFCKHDPLIKKTQCTY